MEKRLFKWNREKTTSEDDIDIYNDNMIDDMVENDEIDAQEEAFIRGYISEF